jgi:hypothetical protein
VTDNLVTVSCPQANLSANGQMTCTGTYVTTQSDVENGQVLNKADVEGVKAIKKQGCCSCGYDYYDVSASASFTATLAGPELELTKTGSPATFTGPDQQISYSYVVKNIGTILLPGPITVSDDLADVTCPGGGLAPGASLTCTGGYTTTAEDVTAGSITNHATASADGAEADDSFTVALEIDPELELSKSADPTIFTKAGTLVRYDFLVTNTGNVTIDGPFELQDEMLDQQECPEGPLAPGASMTCVGYYLTRESDANQTINNCARVRGYYLGGPVRSPEACAAVYYQEPREKPEPEPVPPSDGGT